MSEISLTSSMRANLSSLRMISGQMGKTQERLSTGLKVNSAIDNASSYYQARSLTNRASDLDALLDSMGQGIQTIQAANEGIEHGLAFLEQMSAVAGQAASQGENIGALRPGTRPDVPQAPEASGNVELITKDLSEYQGYTVLNQAMADSGELQSLLQNGGKFVLAEDITLNAMIDLQGVSDLLLDGNGHSISFDESGSDQPMGTMFFVAEGNLNLTNIELNYSAPAVTMMGVYYGATAAVFVGMGNVDLSSFRINSHGENVNAVAGVLNSKITVDTDAGVTVDAGSVKFYTSDYSSVNDPRLYDGQGNTAAAVKELGTGALAAKAATQFYAPGVAANDADFGAGTWYLPSIGELAKLYGTDMTQVSNEFYGDSGAVGDNLAKINATFGTMGGDAETMRGYYWSSSEYNINYSWGLDMGNGLRYSYGKNDDDYVRIFQLVENCFYPFNSSEAASGSEGTGGLSAPKIGDVMYSDKTWGSADDYAAAKAVGKVAVGVVCDVNEGDGSVKIVNLKDLRFSSYGSEGNFDATNPYSGSVGYTQWATDEYYATDVKGIDNFTGIGTVITVGNQPVGGTGGTTGDTGNTGDTSGVGGGGAINDKSYADQFNRILTEYDKLITDASYQGINLLKGGKLNVTFNETRSHRFTVQGTDISSAALGIQNAEWEDMADVETARGEIQKAIAVLRNLSTELGNNYQVIQTRQNFTDALIDVLETGSDNLTLADMNEESANYLALQTRQQLAINSLSLAAQSAQSILSLF